MNSTSKKSLLDTSHLKTDLKKRSLRSGSITLTSQALQFVIMLGSTMILARILTPNDYGMMAMVAAINGFAGLFLDLGLATATIQKPDINNAQVSALFWINAGVGLLLMVIIAGLSPAIAMFYDKPELTWVALVMSTIFFMNGLGVQHRALLNRQMRFFSFGVIQVGSSIVGVIVAVYFALKGFGYWALVANRITETACILVFTWFVTRWMPERPGRAEGVGSMIKFGSDILAFNVINYFSRNLDKILLGRFHGSGPLGLYNKAYQLLMMPIQNLRNPLIQVALPALSNLQNDPEKYRNYYRKFISILAFVSMPLVVFLFLCSDQIVNIVLGAQWHETSELFRILACIAFIQPISSTRGLVLISTGKSRRNLVLGAASSVLICFCFAAGVRWGAQGVATGYAIGEYIGLFPFLYLSFKDTPVSIVDFLNATRRPFLSSLIMGVLVFSLVQILPEFNDIIVVIFTFFACSILYLIAMIIFSNGTEEICEYLNYGKMVLSKGENLF